jgi:F-type H+-transporting ATPase subunit delta
MAELITLARPYAKAAFRTAFTAGALDLWSGMLATAAAVTEQKAVVNLLGSPTLTTAAQAKVVIDVCGDALNDKGQNFIYALATNRRLPLLTEIYGQFELLKAELEKTMDVNVVSAYQVSDEQQANLVTALKAKMGRDVSLQVTVDKSLIGGAIVRAGDTVLDSSVRGSLAKLAEALNS